MQQFFKFLFASCLGTLLALGALIFILVGIGAASGGKKTAKISANSVLHLKFDQSIPERTNNVETDPFSFDTEDVLGLSDIVDAISQAKADDKVKGIFLETEVIRTGMSTTEMLRNAIEDFRESGKFVVAYGSFMSQPSYYVASAADEIHINPGGLLDFRGFASQVPFMKEGLDRLGVKMQIYYAGKFKSATEPLRLTEMSDDNKLQIRELLSDVYDNFLNDISASRNISTTELNRLASTYGATDPYDAKANKMIDAVSYREGALVSIREKLGLESDDKIKFVNISDYRSANPKKFNFSKKDKIAVIYAEGNIVDGEGDNGNIGDKRYVKIIDKVANDKAVKAVVLRVNSGGGSALSSDNMHNAFMRLKEKGIPMVVSMGDYAASGGYLIACPADSIFAEPNTLTGSIGVFSVIPDFSDMMEDKLGITFDTVKTTPVADGITPFLPVDPIEGQYLQLRTDRLYETFLKRVSDGRGLSRDEVHEVAQGRVWTGRQAVKNGLVDRLGGLEDAMASAAALAGLEEYRLTEYPRIKDPITKLMEDLTGQKSTEAVTKAVLKSKLGENYNAIEHLDQIMNTEGPQMRIPFLVELR